MTKKQIIQLMQDQPHVLLTGILTGRIAFTVKNFHALIGVAVHWFEHIRHLKEAIDRKTEINKTAREKYKRLSRRNMSLSGENSSLRYEVSQLKKKLEGKGISSEKTVNEQLLWSEVQSLRMKIGAFQIENNRLRKDLSRIALSSSFQDLEDFLEGVFDPEIYLLIQRIHSN